MSGHLQRTIEMFDADGKFVRMVTREHAQALVNQGARWTIFGKKIQMAKPVQESIAPRIGAPVLVEAQPVFDLFDGNSKYVGDPEGDTFAEVVRFVERTAKYRWLRR